MTSEKEIFSDQGSKSRGRESLEMKRGLGRMDDALGETLERAAVSTVP